MIPPFYPEKYVVPVCKKKTNLNVTVWKDSSKDSKRENVHLEMKLGKNEQ